MTNADSIIKQFTTRVRELILQMKHLKEKNYELQDINEQREQEIQQLKKQLLEQQKQYKTMMMAKMLSISTGDIEDARQRISKLIRSIDECINLQNVRDAQDTPQ